MICYRDQCYCESDCINKNCVRLLTHDVKAKAREWWGEDGAPIATADFSVECKDYQTEKVQ